MWILWCLCRYGHSGPPWPMVGAVSMSQEHGFMSYAHGFHVICTWFSCHLYMVSMSYIHGFLVTCTRNPCLNDMESMLKWHGNHVIWHEKIWKSCQMTWKNMKIMFSQKLETQFRTVPTTILYMFRTCLNVLNNHRYIEKLYETTKDISSLLVGFQICQNHRKSPKSWKIMVIIFLGDFANLEANQ